MLKAVRLDQTAWKWQEHTNILTLLAEGIVKGNKEVLALGNMLDHILEECLLRIDKKLKGRLITLADPCNGKRAA
jgi:hypothetical protein